MVVLNVSQHVAVVIGHAWLINYAQCAKIVQKRAKNEVFGRFVDFGDSDRLDIAYDGSPKRFCVTRRISASLANWLIILINHRSHLFLKKKHKLHEK